MSGFIFILNQNNEPVSKNLMQKLVDSLHTKGPDRKSIHIEENIAMGHTLFKTTYESEYDNQPTSVDGKTWIVSSARIDRRYELVKKLGIDKDIDLSKCDDSELILHAYRYWGDKCTKHLIGDYAFVIWDKQQKRVFCARDQLGMKQLYFAYKNHLLIISNSLYTLTKHPQITNTFNRKSIGGFLLFGDHTWLDKSMTVFRDIKSLLPAHQLISEERGRYPTISKYWSISYDTPVLEYKKKSDYIEHFNELFEIAVRDRIRNSSIAITMSGGMDSTSIAAVAKEIQGKSLNTFNIQAITAVYDKVHPCQERYYSKLVSEKLNIPIHYLSGDNYKIFDPYVLTTRPLEMLTPSFWLDIHKTLLCFSRVYLNGASADNLLNFSPPFSFKNNINIPILFFQMLKMRLLYGKFPPLGLNIKKRILHKTENNIISTSGYPTWLNPEFEEAEQLKEEWREVKMRKFRQMHKVHSGVYNSLLFPEWSSDDILMSPLTTFPEARDPFLDIRIIEFIFSLPLLPWLFNKHILREAMIDKLPKKVIRRPKTFLGNLNTSLINKPESKWLNDWKPHDILKEYILLNKVKPLTQQTHDMELRPLYLEKWLQHIK